MAQAPGSPLVGRDGEVATLVAAAEEARAGRPRCVVVTGEAGIGKTRLVGEAITRLDDALVLTGHGADMATGEIPFGVLAETLRDLRYQHEEVALTQEERMRLAPLLPGAADSVPAEPTRILGGALDLLTRLSRDQLVVWVVEDLHWTDDATRDLVNLSARSVHGRLLLIITARTQDPAPPSAEEAALAEQISLLTRLPHAMRVGLPRLTADEVRVLARSLDADLLPDQLTKITRLSDGIPFMVEELVAARGLPTQTTVASAMNGRVSRLRPDVRTLLEAAAIGHGHLRISLLEQVVASHVDDPDAALAGAVDAGVVSYDYSQDRVGFQHALLRQAVDATIGPRARRGRHRRWAQVLEENPGVLAADLAILAIAEHWHQGGDVPRAVSAAYAAIPAARRTSDDNRNLTLWVRILEGWETRDQESPVGRLTLRRAIGEAFKGPHRAYDDRVTARFLAAAEKLPLRDLERAFLEMLRPRLFLASTGEPDNSDAVARADAACDWLTEPADELTRTALSYIGMHLPLDEGDRADALLDRAELLAEESGDRDRLLHVARARSFRLTAAGEYTAAVRAAERAWSLTDPEDVANRLEFAGDLGWSYHAAGRHHAADRLMTEQLETVPHPQMVPGAWEHLVENAVWNWLCIGEWTRARRVTEQTSPWWPDDLRLSNLWLARLDLLQAGRTDERRWRGHVGGAPIPRGPDDFYLRWLLAQATGLRGDLAGMRALISATWDDIEVPYLQGAWQAIVDLARQEADAAIVDPDRQDHTEGATHLDGMVGVFARAVTSPPHETAAAQDLAAQLDRFHGRDARPALEAALQAWEALDHVPDVAVTHLSLAEAHAEAGDRDPAREHLAQGREIAAELDARPWLDRATAIAHRYGFTTRARRPEDVLTRREAEVLELLAEGRTNQEIADTLVISPKTASVHVSRIIAKTGAGNRTEAVAIARRHGLLDTHGH